MKRILVIALALLIGGRAFSQSAVPEKDDIGALLVADFDSEEDAMRFVVREIMFQLNLTPEVYNPDLGYLITERFYYQGWLNCQFVLFFKKVGDGVAVKIVGRDYFDQRGPNIHSGPMKYKKGMQGSPVESYWKFLTFFAEKIPHSSLEYISE